ncbi:MAG TPA: PEP-utilizing enzyme [Anaerolineae bacterium]|nr:PEP-utilizing enzyme [Anaerolineae bacterium]
MPKFPEHGYNPTTGEWNDSLTGDFLWSNVNVSEAVPDVMTPSTWSLWWIHHYEANPIKFPGNYPFCGNICGRPYLNLSLLVSVYRAVGKDVREELQGDMISSAPANLNIPMISFSPLAVLWTSLPGLLKAQRYVSRDRRKIPEFVAATPGWCRSQRMQIQALHSGDKLILLSLWREAIKPYFLQACRSLRGVTMLFSDPATRLRLDLIRLAGEADANTIMSNLAGASADLESLGPLVGLAQVTRGDMSRDAYLERYGHRGPHEMELSAPGAEEDPDWLDRRLAEFTQAQVDVETLLGKQRAAYAAAWQRFEVRYPHKANAIQRMLDQVAAAARTREAVRSEVTRLTRLIRQFARRAGELTSLGDDIFFLSLDEIAAVLSGDETPVAYIPARRETYTRYKALPPYPAIIIGRFDPLRWAADPNRRSDYFDARGSTLTPAPTTITGFAGAAGRVEGIVRRVDSPEEGDLLQPGEILVTVTTNVGWTPIFPRAIAIITDVGAPLSHAAIVARELGIPAVVGCGNATMRLKTGDRVRVDGGRGAVEILETADR